MKKIPGPGRKPALLLLLGCLSGPGATQYLGNAQGEAWMGRPLEVMLPARFASTASDDECVQADVFYGESRLAGPQVHTEILGPAGERRVRVATLVPVNEPVVSVVVRAGCRNTVTRRYTLLPNFPTQQMLAAVPLPSSRGATQPVQVKEVETAVAASPARKLRAAPERPAAPRAAPVRVAVAPQTAPAPPPRQVRAPGARPPPEVSGSRPRLQLDVWEPEPTGAVLRASTQLADPAGDAARRAAAALLWKAINADPQELLRATAQLRELESELARLRRTASQTGTELAALHAQMNSGPRASGAIAREPWLLALLLSLLLAGGVLGLLWRRGRPGGRERMWYVPASGGTRPSVDPPQAASPVPAPSRAGLRSRGGAAPRNLPPLELEPAELALGPQQAGAANATAAPAATAQPQGFPQADTILSLRVETLTHVLQEVDFLLSLGLRSDALDVLRSYVQDSQAPAPLAFFELMRVCAQADDAAGLSAARRRYADVFGVAPPALERIQADAVLEDHPELARKVTVAWGSVQAASMLEEELFTVPAPDHACSAQALRELLALYPLALALVRGADGGASDACLAPWADAEDVQQAMAAAQQAAEPAGGYRFALDLDLGARVPEPVAPEPELVEALGAQATPGAVAAFERQAGERPLQPQGA